VPVKSSLPEHIGYKRILKIFEENTEKQEDTEITKGRS
jgi:hypothetical protein